MPTHAYWFFPVLAIAWMMIIGAIVIAYLYRKSGVTFSGFVRGYSDELSILGVLQFGRILKLVRKEKSRVVYWLAFLGAALLILDMFSLVYTGRPVHP